MEMEREISREIHSPAQPRLGLGARTPYMQHAAATRNADRCQSAAGGATARQTVRPRKWLSGDSCQPMGTGKAGDHNGPPLARRTKRERERERQRRRGCAHGQRGWGVGCGISVRRVLVLRQAGADMVCGGAGYPGLACERPGNQGEELRGKEGSDWG
ncbi:hypothetical protein OH76DRAFT_85726 [Lentinus brumalis]|uniref:Uncharacterized protein n=1 Tax=Lentinus brumalis TaxID=2498619 RepID=A0A371CR23_9APHY|nr:hypothetical protein OH76DRAFT_85726 [Polyporus brumalis]